MVNSITWVFHSRESVRIIVLTPNWVSISFLYQVSPMFLLLSLLVISFYICIWSLLLYLFHTISDYITALSLYSFLIKLLLYFSYFLQDSLTCIYITLMFITSWYYQYCVFITSILSMVIIHYVSSLHSLNSFILLYFGS